MYQFIFFVGGVGKTTLFYLKEITISQLENNNKKRPKAEHLVNNDIPFGKLFIIDENGEKLGVLPKRDAIAEAKSRGLDLVVISDNPQQPVAKILDYGKFKYERKKKRKEAKANQVVVENKEIRLTPMIGKHDLETKAKQARKFLLEGNRVKVSLKFRGRELARKELGFERHNEFLALLEDIVKVDKAPEMNGNNFLDMYLSRDKNKTPKEDK